MKINVAMFARIHLLAFLFPLVGAGWLYPVASHAQVISKNAKEGEAGATPDQNGVKYYVRYAVASDALPKRSIVIVAQLRGVWVSMPDQPVRFANENDTSVETVDVNAYGFAAEFYPYPDGKWLCVDRKIGTGFNVVYLYRRTGETSMRPVYPNNHRFDEAAWLQYARYARISPKFVSKMSRSMFYRVFTIFEAWSKDSKQLSFRLYSTDLKQNREASGKFDLNRQRFRRLKSAVSDRI